MTILGMEWYWWLIILTVVVISIPFKIRFLVWWDKHQREKKNERRGKWGEGE